jgi:AraC-like DNA-binding protein
LNSNRHDAAALERVLAHVRQHLDQPLRITALSRLAGLSPYQLDRRMKAVFGMPLKALIDRERIEKACELLRSSPNYISQIALECGYTDQAAFTRHFRQTVGLTPTAYRQGI